MTPRKPKRAPLSPLERLKQGKLTQEDLRALARLRGAISRGGPDTFSAANSLIASYTEFRKRLRGIDEILAQNPKNLIERQPPTRGSC
tara:strand:- start:402 stop:665 length:264 start_codon:yes stop_codon:yes gene_type:complete